MATREASAEMSPMFPAPRRKRGHGLRNTLLAGGAGLVVLGVGYAISRSEKPINSTLPSQAQGQEFPPAGTGDDPPKPPEIPVVAPPPDTAPVADNKTEPTITESKDESKTAPVAPEKELVCAIFEPKYCGLIEIVHWENPQGQKFKMGAVKLPEGVSRIPLKAPIRGKVAKTRNNEPAQIHGFSAILIDPSNPHRTFNFRGDLQFPDMLTKDTAQGTEFGYVVDTGIFNRGGYKLFFYVLDESRYDDQALREMVPGETFRESIPTLAFQGTTKPATNYYDIYSSKPQ